MYSYQYYTLLTYLTYLTLSYSFLLIIKATYLNTLNTDQLLLGNAGAYSGLD